MPRSEGRLRDRNIIGQKMRPRRLNRAEQQVLVNTVESAMNDGRSTEARVYWNTMGVWCAPVRVDRGAKLDD